MSYVITSGCVGVRDQACVQVCPVDCIHDAGTQFVIHPDECVDCGACAAVCRIDAIFYDADLPEEHAVALAFNRDFFQR